MFTEVGCRDFPHIIFRANGSVPTFSFVFPLALCWRIPRPNSFCKQSYISTFWAQFLFVQAFLCFNNLLLVLLRPFIQPLCLFCVDPSLYVVILGTRVKNERRLTGLLDQLDDSTWSPCGIVVHIGCRSTWRSHITKEILKGTQSALWPRWPGH